MTVLDPMSATAHTDLTAIFPHLLNYVAFSPRPLRDGETCERPMNTADKDRYAYLAARARIENQIIQLAKARGISVSVEVDPDPAASEGHQIQLTYGRSRRVVAVDHETFIDEEFFRTLVLHQLQAAIEELAASA
jgi:hypothetical protein